MPDNNNAETVGTADDHYHDQRPIIATTVESPWARADEPTLLAAGPAPAVTVVNPAAIGDPGATPILCIDPGVANLLNQTRPQETKAGRRPTEP